VIVAWVLEVIRVLVVSVFAAYERFQEQFDDDPLVDKMEECRAMQSPE
jgi:hypothetical protein